MQRPLPLPGDLLWIRQQRWRVERALRDRHVVRLDVASRDRRLTFLAPFDRPIADGADRRFRRVRRQAATARAARVLARAADERLPMSLIPADAQILAYQLEPALALAGGAARILLADDVGLGKTIQAGLAIAEVVRREPSARVLVVAPASLRDQWRAELADRFGLSTLVADRAGLDDAARSGAYGENPWRRAAIWLASPDFIKQQHVLDALPRDPWDLVVIDEAHAVSGQSDRHAACHSVTSHARRVVLMTATPHSGDSLRFSRVLDLGRVTPAESGPVIFRRTRQDLGLPANRRVRWLSVRIGEAEEAALAALMAFERAVHGNHDCPDEALLLLSVFRKRALSTFTALSQSLSRRLAVLGDEDAGGWVDFRQSRLAFEDEDEDAAADDRALLCGQTGLDPRRERAWLRRVRRLADLAASRESKVARLASLIGRTTEPVVVFSEFRDSLDVISRRLKLSRATAILHGDQDEAERRRHLQRFLAGSASVLLATDVAGQGLNLQSRARWVISLELPWNPARLEQRIGRVDRLLQARTPHLTLLVARHGAEAGLLTHLSKRVALVQRSFAPDALAGLAPAESTVRRALLGLDEPVVAGGAVDLQPAALPASTPRRWKRLAVVAARALARRRYYAHCWRAPEASNAPVWTTTKRAIGPGGSRAVALCSVPILDEQGELVEQYLAVVTCPAGGLPCIVAEAGPVAGALGERLARDAARRVTRAQRRLARSATCSIARERGVHAAIAAADPLGEAQLGLFDSREARAFDARREEDARATGAGEARLNRLAAKTRLHAGAVQVEVAWVPRK